MVAAGLVEYYRREQIPVKNYLFNCINVNRKYNTSEMSIFYQIPQYALIGVSEVFASVGSKYIFLDMAKLPKTIH